MTALVRKAAIVNDRPNLSSERMLHKDYDRKCSVGKKNPVVGLRGLVAKTDWRLTASCKVTLTELKSCGIFAG
jgi:hypothetical protein